MRGSQQEEHSRFVFLMYFEGIGLAGDDYFSIDETIDQRGNEVTARKDQPRQVRVTRICQSATFAPGARTAVHLPALVR